MGAMSGEEQAVQDGRLARGEEARRRILEHAVDVASLEGLEGLTIGRLAADLGMSKSGLFAHFGSKEDLQLAVVDAARDIFVSLVVEPSLAEKRGLRRLLALLDGWLSYLESGIFSGGCFFVAAASEFDGRPGPVRDRIAELLRTWKSVLVEEVRRAQSKGEVAAQADAAQIAFELHAFVQEANWAFQLFQDGNAPAHARRAIRSRLKQVATETGVPMLAGSRAGYSAQLRTDN